VLFMVSGDERVHELFPGFVMGRQGAEIVEHFRRCCGPPLDEHAGLHHRIDPKTRLCWHWPPHPDNVPTPDSN
jgi:hypothetical protein